jgi:hypothetical protein|uniref:Tail tubular protein n=1 Tax=Podoviridae sp. ctvSF8 TaxID=2827621 RepID=A0A8S5LKV1_9CAUD|nr:MAG TPA: tail tubular protein [Podoviridae sp. ctvSF8]
MNIDRQLANRALSAIGEPQLNETDKESKSFLLVKKFYLPTMLESLEMIPWTSGKKRARLEKDLSENHTDYSGAFKLPIDCGKIIELKDKSYYIVEGKTLYTDAAEAVLLYITNGKLQEGMGNVDDDFPDYDPPEYEAMFYQAFELRLASKLALELSGKPELHKMLLQEAAMIEEAAYRNTKTLSAGKKKGNSWWTD